MPRAKKRITYAAAEKLYPNEWVVFCEPRIDQQTDKLIDGVVYFHGADQREAFRRSGGIEGRASIYYMGSIPYRAVRLSDDHASRKKVA